MIRIIHLVGLLLLQSAKFLQLAAVLLFTVRSGRARALVPR